jgi:glycosyltransferase involved in cell wall biosynthesis
MSGATEGKRLGTAGYSYDFVARLFAPMLEQLGKVVEVKRPHTELPGLIQAARQRHQDPILVSFRPFQDAFMTPLARNVVVPAWEFPDIPDIQFDGNPQNDWVETANQCALVLVGGPFTANALEAAGVKTPIRIVPVPTPEKYFRLPRWQSDFRATLDCAPYVFDAIDVRAFSFGGRPRTTRQRLSGMLRGLGFRVYRQLIKRWLPRRVEPIVTSVLRTAISSLREQFLPPRSAQGLDLGGIVYTSIFNPNDGRKNWEDMITAFLCALRDCDDATLVLKLISSSPAAIHRVISFYRRLDVSHRCRLVLIPDFLSEADMLQLARVSAYYLTTTRAEGNCLPLMNYLAAGRPGISPAHTAIADYFDSRVGFVVESHPEPAAWPQDSLLRWRTSWHRLVWPSLVEQIRRSYETAKHDRAAYQAMAAAGQEKMREWAHPDAVWRCLQSAVQVLRPNGEAACQLAPSNALPAPPMATAKKLHQDSPLPQAGEVPGVKAAGLEASSRLGRLVGPADGERRLSAGARPMKVVVSLLNFRPGKIGGTETYLRQLIPRLPHVSPQFEIVLLMDRDLARDNVFRGIDWAVINQSARQVLCARGLEGTSPYRAREVERALARLQPDVVFFPQQSIFPKNVAAPCALVVHDLYHLFLPQYLSAGQRFFRRRSYGYAMSRAERIIAISHFTQKSILTHYAVDAERVAVIPHGWDGAPTAVEADAGFGGKYLYYPAITRPHKNHHLLLETIAALRARGSFDYQLVLSGIQTAHWKNLGRQIRRLGLEDVVRHVGYVPYDRVRRLYRGAQCVVFPSSYEGFGLPILEAVEAGKKILVSRLEVFDELGVPARFQIDFSDPEQFARALEEPGVTALENRPWTWDEAAAATMSILASAAGREAAAPRLIRAA